MKKILWGLLGAILVCVVSVVGTVAVLKPLSPQVEVETETNDSRIVTAVEGPDQLVLMSASVQGLHQENRETQVRKWRIPGSSRTLFLQYNYQAKLGIEGGEVEIEQDGDNRFIVTIPEFIFIGHDEVTFKTAIEDNGALSFVTPDIDTAETITRILDDDKKAEHVESNRGLLQDQARRFYTGIVEAIDPGVELEFQFS